MTITCLTTNCNIVVLDKGDYIVMNGIKYEFTDAYTNMNLEAFIELLRDITLKDKRENETSKNKKVVLSVNGIDLYIDNTRRLCFVSNSEFVINDASYNVKMITGMYHVNLPMKANYDESINEIKFQALSAGFNLSSPVLY